MYPRLIKVLGRDQVAHVRAFGQPKVSSIVPMWEWFPSHRCHVALSSFVAYQPLPFVKQTTSQFDSLQVVVTDWRKGSLVVQVIDFIVGVLNTVFIKWLQCNFFKGFVKVVEKYARQVGRTKRVRVIKANHIVIQGNVLNAILRSQFVADLNRLFFNYLDSTSHVIRVNENIVKNSILWPFHTLAVTAVAMLSSEIECRLNF
jgi:hypothetical protein